MNGTDCAVLAINRSTCPAIRSFMAGRGAYVHPSTPAEALAFVHSQQEVWKPALERVAMQFEKK
jgi:predicted phage gp36 major capsid-like protein